ncbi:MAG: MBL fold metallo-hydrolase [Myxococcales bacterium]|nr:MAG: MBL fold metallo-hydrolase [Myxococcales bacterium]
MIFRQLFESMSSTYTYLLGCEETGEAALIDPVYPTWERDLDVLRSLGLGLALTVETHVHADHITSALRLKEEAGSRIAYPAVDRCDCADVAIEEGRPLEVGSIRITPIYTPGHTDDHFSYLVANRVFTGDALLIDGCGRTDFQNGDASALYRSIREKLFTLPDDTLVYPAHDYNDRRVSTIAQERKRNPRVGGEKTLEEFVTLMNGLGLPYPKFIDHAVPGNRECGVCPTDLPDNMKEYCARMTESPQG